MKYIQLTAEDSMMHCVPKGKFYINVDDIMYLYAEKWGGTVITTREQGDGGNTWIVVKESMEAVMRMIEAVEIMSGDQYKETARILCDYIKRKREEANADAGKSDE